MCALIDYVVININSIISNWLLNCINFSLKDECDLDNKVRHKVKWSESVVNLTYNCVYRCWDGIYLVVNHFNCELYIQLFLITYECKLVWTLRCDSAAAKEWNRNSLTNGYYNSYLTKTIKLWSLLIVIRSTLWSYFGTLFNLVFSIIFLYLSIDDSSVYNFRFK